MKRIAVSVMALGLVLALAGAGTFAYFSDTETSTGNTFSAGTLDLTLNENNGQNVSFSFSNLKPGSQPKVSYKVNNVGTISGYLDIEEISVASYENDCTEPEVQAGDSTCGTGADQGELDDVLNLRMFLDYDGNGWISTGEPVFFNGKIKDLPLNFELNEPVPANGGTDFVAEIYDWWNTADDNKAQSDSVVINMTFELAQTQAQ